MNPVPERETPLHLFVECSSVDPFLSRVYAWLTNADETERANFSTREIFGIFNTGNTDRDATMGTVVIILKKYIWDCKLRKTLPDVNDAIGRIVGELDVMIDCSKSLKHNIEYSGLGNIIANPP